MSQEWEVWRDEPEYSGGFEWVRFDLIGNFDRANVAVDNLRTCKMTAESIVGPAIVDTINL